MHGVEWDPLGQAKHAGLMACFSFLHPPCPISAPQNTSPRRFAVPVLFNVCPLLLALHLLPTPHSGPSTDNWPPEIGGWVFFPSCYSSGYTNIEGGDNMTRHATIPVDRSMLG